MAFGEALPAIAALSERAQEALGQESAYSLVHKFVCQAKKNCDADEFVQFTKILNKIVDNISFNPRTPCGVRPTPLHNCTVYFWFQSTHSLRSATLLLLVPFPCGWFQSTHSLRSATLHR